ncbi:hypothetical protein [Kitasatospora purpeofusca]|uniref:DUF7683 domain-containing protein n=1 Tax=Kitasatospora purpeofusca TaxID=67352 RepID=UPI002A5AF4A8|nr:hypothetical protein [Kitasatospora purpeofusca]MDY0810705.1 hypothetical protein [Kitasatospora purpeofusca]
MWYLECFSRSTEELIEEIALTSVNGEKVRALLSLPDDEDVYAGGYPVTGEVLDALARPAGHAPRPDAEYFVAYTAPRIPVWTSGEEPAVFWRDGVLVNLNATREPGPTDT